MPDPLVRHSKFLSFVLRHQPEAIGIALDASGWVHVSDLLPALAARDPAWTTDLLDHVVVNNDKRRFEFSPDRTRIRASQGHSVDVNLEYAPASPPSRLFHGTPARHVAAILVEGIRKMGRHHVHLSPSVTTAQAVGQRRGPCVVLVVRADEMAAAGATFFESTNGVWLTEHVPPQFIEEAS